MSGHIKPLLDVLSAGNSKPICPWRIEFVAMRGSYSRVDTEARSNTESALAQELVRVELQTREPACTILTGESDDDAADSSGTSFFDSVGVAQLSGPEDRETTPIISRIVEEMRLRVCNWRSAEAA